MTKQSKRSGATRTDSGRVARVRSKGEVRVLFTCVGRRVELLNAFRAAADRMGVSLEIHGADASYMSPAMHCVDKKHRVPPIAGGRYISSLLSLVRRARIQLLIPLIDTELLPIAAAVGRFEAAGCRALVSSESVVGICRDKLATFETLRSAGIDTPITKPWVEVVKQKRHKFPYFLKPRAGSAATGNYKIHNKAELDTFGRLVPDAIVQEFVGGVEYTLDVYTGFDGQPRCVVPRKRLEVRSGEVSKGLIVKNPEVMAVGRRVAETLGDCRGVVTAQCMVTPRGRIRVIEINPRFGGGAPLAIHAGADFPRWILSELLGIKPQIRANAFRDDVLMLRHDESVFVPNGSRLT